MIKILSMVVSGILVLFLLPFVILMRIFRKFTGKSNIEIGEQIKNSCLQHGVPEHYYNQIVLTRMDEARKDAIQIQKSPDYRNRPWGASLSRAIIDLYLVDEAVDERMQEIKDLTKSRTDTYQDMIDRAVDGEDAK